MLQNAKTLPLHIHRPMTRSGICNSPVMVKSDQHRLKSDQHRLSPDVEGIVSFFQFECVHVCAHMSRMALRGRGEHQTKLCLIRSTTVHPPHTHTHLRMGVLLRINPSVSANNLLVEMLTFLSCMLVHLFTT